MGTELLDARLKLGMVSGLGPLLTRRLVEHFGDAVAATGATAAQLQRIDGIGAATARSIREQLDQCDIDREKQLITEHEVRVIGIDDEDYPALLRHIPDPPTLLYVRGQLDRTDAVALAVVGSRRCTAYGREQADRIAAACAQAGLTIVSGGARGIDSAAHRAALRLEGRTLVVLGCGLARVYPPENAELFSEIADGHGAIVSELPMTAPPIAENFPRRNRIISGLSLGVLVVEAALRSGALITARLAAEEHHREVMALPGRVDSAASVGCHRIIREGWANLVTNAADILDCLGETGAALRGAMEERAETEQQADEQLSLENAGLSREQTDLLAKLGGDELDFDRLAERTGLPVAMIQSHLTMLQLRGLVERVPGNRVRRKR